MATQTRPGVRNTLLRWALAIAYSLAVFVTQDSRASGATIPVQLHSDSAQHAHLYIAGGISGIPGVYRFPLTDGLPSKIPDQVLTGGHPFWPLSVGFDGMNYEYVSDYIGNMIRIYAPGATGNAEPVRQIPIPGHTTWIAVRKDGYLFDVVGNYGVQVFAPGVGDPALPPPQPLLKLGGTPSEESFGDILLDSSGRLYAQTLFQFVYVYDHPLQHWQSPDHIIMAQSPSEGEITSPMALEAERNRLWFQVQTPLYSPPWDHADHAARDLSPGDSQVDEMSAAKECHNGNMGDAEYGMAVDRKYLIFSCPEYGSAGAVLVYRNAPGKQSLVEVISPQGLTNPAGLTFGP